MSAPSAAERETGVRSLWSGPRRFISSSHAAKFRQAAFVYLHVGILYLAAVWAIHGQGLLPEGRGPIGVWMAMGVLIIAVVFLGLWRYMNVWVARVVWALHALRAPALIEGAFFPDPAAALPPAFYLTALVVVLVNLWMLARAGWDI